VILAAARATPWVWSAAVVLGASTTIRPLAVAGSAARGGFVLRGNEKAREANARPSYFTSSLNAKV
jgi:hypothetical protein